MRLSVNLTEDNYRLAKSLAREEDISISKAINRLLQFGLQPSQPKNSSPARTRSGFTSVAGKQTVTSDDVADFLANSS